MAQVPNYNPIPQSTPSDRPLPQVSISSPSAAFGGATAEATSRLGGTLEKVGDELFARAQALQQLKNETDAKDQDVKFMIAAGEMHAKYGELQGSDRVAAFPKYSADLQDLYKQHRDSLGNPMAQRMFDSSAVSTLQRSIFSGARAAGEAQRQAALTSINAKETLLEKRTFDTGSEADFREGVEDIKRNAAQKAALMEGGWSSEREELLIKQGVSNLAYNRVIGLARNQPYQASQMLEKYKAEGLLFGPQLEAATNKVQSFTESVGTDIISTKVMERYRQPDGTFSKSAGDMRDEAVAQAKLLYPDDPKIGSATEKTFDAGYSRHNYIQQQEKREVDQKLSEYIVRGAGSVDVLPQGLVQRMTPQQIKDYPTQANRYKSAIDKQTNQQTAETLLGIYNTDNAKFMDLNIMNIEGLSKTDMDRFLRLQRTVAANGDPRVSRAMGWLRGAVPGAMEELGISKRGDEQNKFVGALHEAIQHWQEDKGKPPTEKDVIKEIFPTLTGKITDPGAWFGATFGKVPFFSATIPSEYKKEIETKEGKEIGEEDLRKRYIGERFKELYAKQKPAKDQGRIGQ